MLKKINSFYLTMSLEQFVEGMREFSGIAIFLGGMSAATYISWTSFRATWNDRAFDGDYSKNTMGKVLVSDVKGAGSYIIYKLNPVKMYNNISDKLSIDCNKLDSNMREIAEKYF